MNVHGVTGTWRLSLTEAPVLEVDGCSEVGSPAYAIALAKRSVRDVQELFWQGAVGRHAKRDKTHVFVDDYDAYVENVILLHPNKKGVALYARQRSRKW